MRQIAAGWGHTLALTDDGRVLAWGEGKAGQLGGGEAISKATPTVLEHYQSVIHIYCGHSHSGFIDSGNDYYSFGFNEDYRLMIGNHKEVHVPMRVPIRDVIAAGLGVNHSCIITRNGELYCGGVGTHGELGIALD